MAEPQAEFSDQIPAMATEPFSRVMIYANQATPKIQNQQRFRRLQGLRLFGVAADT